MLPENHPMTRMCERVVARLAPATGMEGVDWKVHVINEDIPNAFVIPGGQIFVFTVLSRLPSPLSLYPIATTPFYPSSRLIPLSFPRISLYYPLFLYPPFSHPNPMLPPDSNPRIPLT